MSQMNTGMQFGIPTNGKLLRIHRVEKIIFKNETFILREISHVIKVDVDVVLWTLCFSFQWYCTVYAVT